MTKAKREPKLRVMKIVRAQMATTEPKAEPEAEHKDKHVREPVAARCWRKPSKHFVTWAVRQHRPHSSSDSGSRARAGGTRFDD